MEVAVSAPADSWTSKRDALWEALRTAADLNESFHHFHLYSFFFYFFILEILFLFKKIFLHLFIYLSLAALGPRCCPRAFSSCGEQGLLFLAVHGLPIAVASPVVEHGL